MGLYNFQERFVPFILSGAKTHTIRATRVHPDVPGNTLHLYTGLRRKGARLIKRVICIKVEDILIRETRSLSSDATDIFEIAIQGVGLEDSEKELLARRDGFKNFAEMMSFWDGRLPFTGQITHWKAA